METSGTSALQGWLVALQDRFDLQGLDGDYQGGDVGREAVFDCKRNLDEACMPWPMQKMMSKSLMLLDHHFCTFY